MVNLHSNKFNFFVPLNIEKGKDSKGGDLVKIKGIASSSSAKDSDGETLIPSGFDFAPLLKTGFLNWNHQATKSAKAICGEPTAAKVINGGKDFYIEGVLYPNAQGKEVADLAYTLEQYSLTRRLGFSIEGQVVEKDPLNPKRITKARITGVAITQSPKNPNTLMSIIKGETDELYVNDEDVEETEEEKKKRLKKEGTTEKAIDTVAIGPATKESVEHKKKPIVGDFLNKSDIYIQINDRYNTDIVKAKEVYNFVLAVNQKLFNNMATITSEVLLKSFDILDGIAKGDEENDFKKKGIDEDVEEKDIDVEDEDLEEDKEVEESENEDFEDDNDEIEETEEEKKIAKGIAKGLISSGMDKEEVIKAMVSSGVSKKLAETSHASCIKEAEALKENGGEVTAAKVPIVKSEEEELGKTEDSFTDLFKGLQDDLGDKFSAVGEILKAIVDDNSSLKESVETLQKSLTDAEQEISTIKSTPNPRKSITTARQVERFEKGEEDGSEVYNISDRRDIARLSDRLFGEVQLMKSNGRQDMQLEKAVSDLEISKSTDYEALIPRLKAMNISLIQE